ERYRRRAAGVVPSARREPMLERQSATIRAANDYPSKLALSRTMHSVITPAIPRIVATSLPVTMALGGDAATT
ncbi:MAG TPA: hypothetical protein VG815_20160, partial [Chloroflexota bacterium]|nr:hypothetical protein [Chloroflexota bacterium]